MPVVPISRHSAKPQPQVSEAYKLMAAAEMHRMGRLLPPEPEPDEPRR